MNSSAATPAPGERASLYVHVPFCCSKCRYCSFYSIPAAGGLMDAYLEALNVEWRLVRDEEPALGSGELRITSVYVGGGTPSILGAERLSRLLEVLRAGPAWAADCEVTVEVNPESTDESVLAAILAAGCNRISMGVQSFRDEELELLGRAGRAADARRALQLIRAAGCGNLNIDLIYGLPGQTVDAWLTSVEEAVAARTEHLSCYMLTPERDTMLHQLLHGGELTTPLDEVVLEQYQALRGVLVGVGMEHYEISNFARPGYRCRHNEGTWTRTPYYGLGPAAHSFDGEARWQNVSDVRAYTHQLRVEQRRPARERYRLGPADVAKELVILGLRRAEGIRWADLAPVTSPAERARLQRRAKFLAGTGFLQLDEERLRLTPQAYFVSNAVFVELVRALEEGVG